MGMGIDEHQLNPNHQISSSKFQGILNDQNPIAKTFGFQKMEFIWIWVLGIWNSCFP
jgi:hypothetical protein